jgi:hypothetical protein
LSKGYATVWFANRIGYQKALDTGKHILENQKVTFKKSLNYFVNYFFVLFFSLLYFHRLILNNGIMLLKTKGINKASF